MNFVSFDPRQGFALQCFLLEIAARPSIATTAPGFEMIDGEWVSQAAGQAALLNGTAVLVGELLVGIVPPDPSTE